MGAGEPQGWNEVVVVNTTTWVVMEGKVGSKIVWGWCRMGTGPGFAEVVFTEPDGMSVPDLGEAPHRLERHLFTVVVPNDEPRARLDIDVDDLRSRPSS